MRRPMHRRRRGRNRLIITVLVCAVVLTALTFVLAKVVGEITERAEKLAYPLAYTVTVNRYADEYGLPRELLYAVILTESSFDPDAVSHSGAVGLMQITPATFNWLMSKTGEEYPQDELYNPETSIRYGAFFLAMLREDFGCWQAALAAYNAGPARLRGWLADGIVTLDGDKLVGVPIDETANYIRRVTAAEEKYRRLYEGQLTAE